MTRITMIAFVLAACGNKSATPSGAGGEPDAAAGVAAFTIVRAVLQHPRCQNCHPAGDAPLQGDEGRVHAMNVLRGPEGRGMVGAECTTCHGPANPPNNYGLHVPPGVIEGWHMPRPEEKLVFVGVEPRASTLARSDPGLLVRSEPDRQVRSSG